jgi:hypothetical protein
MNFRQSNRRRFLKSGIVAVALSLLAALGYKLKLFEKKNTQVTPLSSSEEQALTAYIDTLIPTDDTPGALDLGIHHKVSERARQNRYLRKRIKKGIIWLNKQAKNKYKEPFHNIATEQREQIVELSEKAPKRSAEFKFYLKIRNEAFHWYYADARTWKFLCYDGPPQPKGFMNYEHPPLTCNQHDIT